MTLPRTRYGRPEQYSYSLIWDECGCVDRPQLTAQRRESFSYRKCLKCGTVNGKWKKR